MYLDKVLKAPDLHGADGGESDDAILRTVLGPRKDHIGRPQGPIGQPVRALVPEKPVVDQRLIDRALRQGHSMDG